jgi:hypothetical protein
MQCAGKYSFKINFITMALIIKIVTPRDLLSLIYKGIDEKKITTWSYEEYNSIKFFTHTPPQWAKKAWFKPSLLDRELKFGIFKAGEQPVSKEVYGIYHGKFSEMLLTHFDMSFTLAKATAMPVPPDGI